MTAHSQHQESRRGVAASGGGPGALGGGLVGLAVVVVGTVLVGNITVLVFAPIAVGLGAVVGVACGGAHQGQHARGRRGSSRSARGQWLTSAPAHAAAGVIPSRSGILGRSLLLGILGGAVMGQVALVVLVVWLVAERL